MIGFIEGEARTQATLLPERLDYITKNNPVRVLDVFIDGINLSRMGFKTCPAATAPSCLSSRNDAETLCLWLP